MPEILAEYFSALARLKAGSPERVEESAYSTQSGHPFHGKVATQSTPN